MLGDPDVGSNFFFLLWGKSTVCSPWTIPVKATEHQSSRASKSNLMRYPVQRGCAPSPEGLPQRGVKWWSPWQTPAFLARPVSGQESLAQLSMSWRQLLRSRVHPSCLHTYAAGHPSTLPWRHSLSLDPSTSSCPPAPWAAYSHHDL